MLGRCRSVFANLCFLWALLPSWIAGTNAASSSGVDFDRDVRPVLSENCFYCHGADAGRRKAKLRLDLSEEALRNGVVVPGKPGNSKLMVRILSSDPEEQMPPPTSNQHLSDSQKQILRAWIKQGAQYDTHWAFKSPVRSALPAVRQRGWVRNPIDRFVLAKLEAEKLHPMPPARPEPLLRRACLDLTGLPPSLEQMKLWLQAKDPLAAALPDMLASPHFGERMASDWMDVARYADTHGFNNDSARTMWRWRDWVIDAFNSNLSYDRFITYQLAGDLLEKPTTDQLIATGFNRNHVINSEGGIVEEEYRVEYVADRVRTTSLAWMGLTMECSRCHDHKFDPITQRDYYRFFAFFNNLDEGGEDGRIANASPFVLSPTSSQREQLAHQYEAIKAAELEMQKLEAAQDWSSNRFEGMLNEIASNRPASNTNTTLLLDTASFHPGSNAVTNLIAKGKPFLVRGLLAVTNGPLGEPALVFSGSNDLRTDSLPSLDSGKGWAFSAWIKREAAQSGPIFSTMNFSVPESSQSYGQGTEIRVTESGAVEVRIATRWPSYAFSFITRESLPLGEWHLVTVYSDGSSRVKGTHALINGEEPFREVLHDDCLGGPGLSGKAVLGGSDEKNAPRFIGCLAAVTLAGAPPSFEATASMQREAAARYAIEASQSGNAKAREQARTAWLEKNNPAFAKSKTRWREARNEALRIEREAPTTMTMQELSQPRPSFILFRGQYDQPRDRVEPGVPEFLLPYPAGAPKNRLGLARWLTDRRNPLTARVVVNRLWQGLFGTGIVKTSEDFGFQSNWPSHPELLDWLAVEFMESGWDVKHLLSLMIDSATYRQDSRSTPDLNERDPENRLLAHGPRQRLTAEMLRDQALFISGLLQDRVGGPPVFPYQPTNLYSGIVVAADYPGTTWVESSGPDLYRRSLYTFWKRTVPNPTLATFDAPDREVCVARRLKTNTPLQALALMNDRIQVEAARKLAERMLAEGGATAADRLRFGFLLATARKPLAAEEKALLGLLEKRTAAYQADPKAAEAALASVAGTPPATVASSQLAAYASVASLLLNLDETITRN